VGIMAIISLSVIVSATALILLIIIFIGELVIIFLNQAFIMRVVLLII
jgi:hypothetical protein